MKLTEHFSLEEFTYSSTALARQIDNSLNPNNHAHAKIISNLTNHCKQILEPLRAHVNEPVIISSGYRCPKLNQAVAGVANSQHMTGETCDIYMDNQNKLREWFEWLAEEVNADQIILEKASKQSDHYWIHISCKHCLSDNRNQVIRFLCKN